jgi:hypothetical protein
MAQQTEQPRQGPSYRQELLATIMLSLSAVGSAVSVWQASLWSGVQAFALADSAAARIEASRFADEANQQMVYDATTFVQFVLAATRHTAEGPPLQELATRFMRPEFRPYVDQWLALDPFKNPQVPANPMALPSFKNERLQESHRLEQVAQKRSDDGKEANRIADEFVLGSVYFSLVLFFSGICTKLRSRYLISACLVLSVAGIVLGTLHLAALPFEH